MATEMAAELAQMKQRRAGLEAFMNSIKITLADGIGERSLGKTVLDMDTYVSTLINDPSLQKRNANESIDERMTGNVEELIYSKLRTALKMSKDSRGEEGAWNKSALESQAIQEISNVSEAIQCRQSCNTLNNAF